MRYHDWHLAGYAISDYGKTITLHLSWDYTGHERKSNCIQFADVAIYNFLHSSDAIITFINEQPISAFIVNEEPFLRNCSAQTWLRYWRKDYDLTAYRAFLENEGFRYWTIDSAVGFAGFVIAKGVSEIAESGKY